MKGTPEEKLPCKCFFFYYDGERGEINTSFIITKQKILVSFKLYDVNHDGYLTKTELERVMLQLVKL